MNEEINQTTLEKRIKREISEASACANRLIDRTIGNDQENGGVGDPLLLPISEEDETIRIVFKEANLDLKNAAHWRALLTAFCNAYVWHVNRPNHRPPEWTADREAELAADIFAIRIDPAKTTMSNSAIAKTLKQDYPYKDTYKDLSVERLRKLVGAMNLQKMLELQKQYPRAFKRYPKTEFD